MKIRKLIAVILVVIAILAALPVSAQERVLTLDRAVQISDNQIILEFSEPIAVNYHNDNTNPWLAIRLGKSGNCDVCQDCGGHLQWWGGYEYVDGERDRLVFTMIPNIGVDNINDIRNRAGKLSHHQDLNLWFCIEETPYNGDAMYVDDTVCNITTLDGEVALTSTYPEGWEKCNVDLEVDFDYDVDLSKTMDLGATVIDRTLLVGGETVAVENPAEETVEPTISNNPVIVAAMLGGSALFAVVLLVVGILIRNKKKAVH